MFLEVVGRTRIQRTGGGIGNIRGWAEESIWLFQVPGAVEESSGASSTSLSLLVENGIGG